MAVLGPFDTNTPVGDRLGSFFKSAPKPSLPLSHFPSAKDITPRTEESVNSTNLSQKRQSKTLRTMFGRSKMDPDTPPSQSIYNPTRRPHTELTSQELTEELSTSLASTNGGSSFSSSSGASIADTKPRMAPNQVASQLMRLTDSKSRGTTTRKRDILLPTIGRPSIEKPLSVSTPLPPWAAPQFFKALSGAVKHSQLATCALSASAIIYISSHSKNGQLVKDIGFGHDVEKTERAIARHRRHVSESITKAKWSEKIFILTPSGYVHQFAAEGPFHRLPEKSVKLGKESVAFASDLIPGRHWVMQLSNVTDPLAPSLAVNLDSQKPRSRLSFKPTEILKPAMNFLLILDSGQELDSWLTAVRHEIAILGRGKSETETASTKIDNEYDNTSVYLRSESESLAHGQTQRYSPWLTSQEPVNEIQSNQDLEYDRVSSRFEERRQSQPRPSIDAMSQAASSISHEGRLLDSLRNSTLHGYPRISIGGQTFLTSSSPSRDTSPSQSPIKETFLRDDEDEIVPGVEVPQQRPNATAINERRRSFMAHQPTILEVVLPERSRPNSMVGPSTQTSSPPAPGFAFNDGVVRQRSARKNPPTALVTRLSVVEDQPSPALYHHTSTVHEEPESSPRHAFNIFDGKPEKNQNPDLLINPRSRRRPSPAAPISTRGLSHENGLTPIPSPTASENEFEFHYWNSRLQNAAPPTISDAPATISRQSLCRSDAFDLERVLRSVGSPTPPPPRVDSPPPPPLPMSSYPYTRDGSHAIPKQEPQPQIGAQQQQQTLPMSSYPYTEEGSLAFHALPEQQSQPQIGAQQQQQQQALPMSSYPYPEEGFHALPKQELRLQIGAQQQQQALEPTDEMDATLFPLPLSPNPVSPDLATPIGRANARAFSTRADRLAGAHTRDSISKPPRRPQRPQSFRPTPPMPLFARDFISDPALPAPPTRPMRSASDSAPPRQGSHIAAQLRMSMAGAPPPHSPFSPPQHPSTADAPPLARNTVGSQRRASILVSPAQATELVHPAVAAPGPGKRSRTARLSERRSVQVSDAPLPPPPPPPPSMVSSSADSLRRMSFPASPALSIETADSGATPGKQGRSWRFGARRSVQSADAGPPLAPPPTRGLPPVPGLAFPLTPAAAQLGWVGMSSSRSRKKK